MRISAALLIGTSAFGLSAPALAQTGQEAAAQPANQAAAPADEQAIIVTATKRASTVQDVPFSVNAQTQADIARLSQEVSGRKPSAQLTAELESIDSLLAGRNEVISVLKSGVLGDTKGVSEYFRAFARQSVDGLWLTGFTVVGAGNDISIEGRALRADLVPIYIQRLGREESLRGHGFATLSVQPPPAVSLSGEMRQTGDLLEFHMASRAPDASATGRQAR